MANATKAVLDFSNVKERGAFSRRNLPEGDYIAKITNVEEAESKGGNNQWIFTVEAQGVRGATYPYYCALTENQLWKIRSLFMAAGINVPKKRVAVDPNKLVGKVIGIELVDDEYNDRINSQINAVFPKDDVNQGDLPDDDEGDEPEDDYEEEEEEPAPKPKARAKKRPAPEPEEDDEELDEDDVEEEPAPRKRPAKKAAVKKKPAPVEEDEEDEEDPDEMEIDEI